MGDSWNGIGEIDCASCGARFSVEGDYTEGAPGVAGESPRDPDEFKPAETRCPACLALGTEPPESPCCGGKLRGAAGDDFAEPFWRCEECDHTFCVTRIRAYALGLTTERIVREDTDHRHNLCCSHYTLVLRAAAQLGIRRPQ